MGVLSLFLSFSLPGIPNFQPGCGLLRKVQEKGNFENGPVLKRGKLPSYNKLGEKGGFRNGSGRSLGRQFLLLAFLIYDWQLISYMATLAALGCRGKCYFFLFLSVPVWSLYSPHHLRPNSPVFPVRISRYTM